MPPQIILELINKAAEHFRLKGIENFRLDAQLLLGHILNMERIELYLNYDRPLAEMEVAQYRNVVRRRASREPLQHILGSVRFRKLNLKIDGRALIPRKETELIIDAVKDVLPLLSSYADSKETISILDVGVGSGAIFLSLLKELSKAVIDGVEFYEDACSLTRENAVLNNLKLNGNLRQGDMFQPFPPGQTWDIIVTNPPYVGRNEFSTLEPEVKLWDPSHALIGGETGTEYPARLIRETYAHVPKGGFLITEIGASQADILIRKAKTCKWLNIQKKQDYSGFDRFLIMQK
jgi:release factor glutamine methyltransferase